MIVGDLGGGTAVGAVVYVGEGGCVGGRFGGGGFGGEEGGGEEACGGGGEKEEGEEGGFCDGFHEGGIGVVIFKEGGVQK